jgi:hexosaminidase
MQGDGIIEPPVYASLRLSKTYEFEPVPDGVDAKYIKGGQANLWTEQVYNMRHAEYMTWPRAFSIAETMWSPKDKKNWNKFVLKVEDHFKRFDYAQTKYAPSMYEPDFKFTKNDKNEITVEMRSEIAVFLFIIHLIILFLIIFIRLFKTCCNTQRCFNNESGDLPGR